MVTYGRVEAVPDAGSFTAAITAYVDGDGDGDGDAARIIYESLQPKLVSSARRLGADDPEGAADLSIFDGLRALERLTGIDDVGFERYVRRALRNRVIDEARQRSRRIETTPVSAPDELAIASEDDIASPRLEAEGLTKVLGYLTDAEREVVVGRYVTGLSNREVADRLGRSESSVRRLHSSALTRLRALGPVVLGLLAVIALIVLLRLVGVLPMALFVDSSPASDPPVAEEEESSLRSEAGAGASEGADESRPTFGADHLSTTASIPPTDDPAASATPAATDSATDDPRPVGPPAGGALAPGGGDDTDAATAPVEDPSTDSPPAGPSTPGPNNHLQPGGPTDDGQGAAPHSNGGQGSGPADEEDRNEVDDSHLAPGHESPGYGSGYGSEGDCRYTITNTSPVAVTASAEAAGSPIPDLGEVPAGGTTTFSLPYDFDPDRDRLFLNGPGGEPTGWSLIGALCGSEHTYTGPEI